MPKFSKRSRDNLKTCDQRLQTLFNIVIRYYDCSIVCGHRTEEEQNKAYKDGFSQLKYPQSKHNKKPSLAVDVIPYPSRYSNTKEFYFMAGIVYILAEMMDIKLKWGGRWNFFDPPHFELEE